MPVLRWTELDSAAPTPEENPLLADGRFLMIKYGDAGGTTAPASIVVVQQWVEELKRLVPTK